MTSIMESSDQNADEEFISSDAVGEETVVIYDDREDSEEVCYTVFETDDMSKNTKENSVSIKSEPTVYITELPKGIITSHQELKIPSKSMDPSGIVLNSIEHDGKGNSVVTIQVPYDEDCSNSGFVGDLSDGYIELELVQEPSSPSTSKIVKHVVVDKNGDIVQKISPLSSPKPVQKLKNKDPIWKRHTPKPPGSVSNYLYPHGLKSIRSRVIIDCPTNIPVQEFKAQLADTSDIVTTLDVAPSTKRKIKELTTNSVSKLFAYPGKPLPCKRLYSLYQRHLTSKPQTHELATDLELLPIGYSPSIDYSQVKRITRKRKVPEENNTDVIVEVLNQVEKLTEKPAESIASKTENKIQSVVPISDQVVRVVIKPGVAGEEEQEILVLHDGSETLEGSASLQHSIEVLLAAAERGELIKEPQQVEQVFICNEGTYDETETDPFMTEQIVIVQNENEEEELCGQTLES